MAASSERKDSQSTPTTTLASPQAPNRNEGVRLEFVVECDRDRIAVIDVRVVFPWPQRWDLRLVQPHVPVDSEDLGQIVDEARAVGDQHAELLHLRQRPPVHVRASDVNVLAVDDPEFRMQNTSAQQPLHIDRPDGGRLLLHEDLRIDVRRHFGRLALSDPNGDLPSRAGFEEVLEDLLALPCRRVVVEVGAAERPVERADVNGLIRDSDQLAPCVEGGHEQRTSSRIGEVLGDALDELNAGKERMSEGVGELGAEIYLQELRQTLG